MARETAEGINDNTAQQSRMAGFRKKKNNGEEPRDNDNASNESQNSDTTIELGHRRDYRQDGSRLPDQNLQPLAWGKVKWPHVAVMACERTPGPGQKHDEVGLHPVAEQQKDPSTIITRRIFRTVMI
nr:hypothetical protein CFP56_37355 [Quercus suber]